MLAFLLNGFLHYLESAIFLVGYISNNSLFPEPLSSSEEQYYLELLSQGNDEAKNILIERNLRLVAHVCKKYSSTNIELDDLISIGTIGLIKGINSFNSSKGVRLATYVSRCVDNEILMYLRKTQKSRQEYSLDEVLSIDSEGNEMILSDIIGSSEPLALTKLSEEEDIRNLYYALDRLSKREREIIIMRYGLFGVEPLTQKEVADKMGISQSYISRLEKRIIEKMRQDIEQLVKIA